MKKIYKFALPSVIVILILILSVIYQKFDTHIVKEKQPKFNEVGDFNKKIKGTTEKNLPPNPFGGYGIRIFDWSGNMVSNRNIEYKPDRQLKYIISVAN